MLYQGAEDEGRKRECAVIEDGNTYNRLTHTPLPNHSNKVDCGIRAEAVVSKDVFIINAPAYKEKADSLRCNPLVSITVSMVPAFSALIVLPVKVFTIKQKKYIYNHNQS